MLHLSRVRVLQARVTAGVMDHEGRVGVPVGRVVQADRVPELVRCDQRPLVKAEGQVGIEADGGGRRRVGAGLVWGHVQGRVEGDVAAGNGLELGVVQV
jgi:hypothetical protein